MTELVLWNLLVTNRAADLQFVIQPTVNNNQSERMAASEIMRFSDTSDFCLST